MKKILILCMCTAMLLAGCGSKSGSNAPSASPSVSPSASPSAPASSSEPSAEEAEMRGRVDIEMEDGGIISIGFYPDYAPETVDNFIKLVKEGFYDGLTFHRVISGFMIQGGDPQGNGTGGSDKTIKGEFAANGYDGNRLNHVRGVISMARSQNFDSASSQFFIMHKTQPSLDGQYAAFGRVTEGMDVVDRIASVETDSNDKPTTRVVIKKMTLVEDIK